MKKTIHTFIAAALFSVVAQAQDGRDTTLKTFSIGLRAVHLYDLPAYRFDDAMSRDMRGLNGDKTSFDLGVDLYLEKQFTPLFGAQLGFRYATLTGANETEYYTNTFYQGQLDLLFILSNLDAFHTNSRWNFYTKAGIGNGSFTSEQFLIEDDAQDDRVEDNFWETHAGAGIQYELNNSLRLELEMLYNVALTDGFDGFDNATGSDNYLTTALGIAYTFGKKEKKPMYAVNYFGGEYLDMGSDASTPDAPSTPVTEEAAAEQPDELGEMRTEIASMENQLEEQKRMLSAVNRKLEKQEEEINQIKNSRNAAMGTGVYFAFDSSYLSNTAKKQLADALGGMENKSDVKLELTAYADKVGSDAYNKDLKQRRAESVQAFLTKLGYNAANISVQMGERSDFGSEDQFLNRKVVVTPL